MGLIKSLIDINTLCALNNHNNKEAARRKKARLVNIIRKSIIRHPIYAHVGVYIIRVTSGDEVHYWKFSGKDIDNTCEDIYNFLNAVNKSLFKISFKFALVRTA